MLVFIGKLQFNVNGLPAYLQTHTLTFNCFNLCITQDRLLRDSGDVPSPHTRLGSLVQNAPRHTKNNSSTLFRILLETH